MARRNRRNSADIAPTKDNRDKAEAMAAYARQAKDNDLIEKATEIRVRAQRKAGEMLRQAAQSGMRSTGGVANRVLAAARDLYLRYEVNCQVLVPAQLYPVEIDSWLASLRQAARIVVVEDGPAGGGWGAEVADCLYPQVWGRLDGPIRSVSARRSVIPAARHLEDQVIVGVDAISHAILEAAGV